MPNVVAGTVLGVGVVALLACAGTETSEEGTETSGAAAETSGEVAEVSQEYPDAVTADPGHYSVEFENDVVRLLRIRYGPGETSVMHHHPANCAIFLTDASATFDLPSGEVVEAGGSERQVTCGDAEVHQPTNTGEEPFQVILVELKGRGAFAP